MGKGKITILYENEQERTQKTPEQQKMKKKQKLKKKKIKYTHNEEPQIQGNEEKQQVSHRDDQQEQQQHEEKQKKINKDKKKKRKKKEKKNKIDYSQAPIQKIYDYQKQQSQPEEQDEEQQYVDDMQQEGYNGYGQQIGGNMRINLREKVKLKHLAICFPDSILEIPQTSALRAYFISQVARISSIFKVDQIVVLRDHGYTSKSQAFNPCQYIARNLQYLQTPQYMRKHLFKMHPDLKNAGLMNPIECHHHLRATDVSEYRQGVTVDRPTKKGAGSWVDIGLKQQAQMDVLLLPNTRVTLKIKNYENLDANCFQAEAVSRRTPRIQKNLYWGYDVRIAKNMKDLIEGGDYDLKIICNHHENIESIPHIVDFDDVDLSDRSVVIFFSGTDDLDNMIARDEKAKLSAEQCVKMFDFSLRFTNFGVQKLRLQEQLFMGLQKMSKFLS